MKKAQLSAEFILIAMIVLAAAFMAFRFYQTTAYVLIAETSMKTSVDWELAKAPLDAPDCGNVYLARFHRNGTIQEDSEGKVLNYTVHTTNGNDILPGACTPIIINSSAEERINGLISISLGNKCRYSHQGSCRGYLFHVHT